MTSSLSWVDFSPSDRERMQRALALFDESETRDELGLGSIRDAFADALFPGTSTIQTRLRYFLFVPWHYLRHEHKHAGSELKSRVARDERRLIQALLANDDTEGVFGKTAGEALKRLPSSVYWAGLRRWEILRVELSHEEYPHAVEGIRERRRGVLRPEDDGVAPDCVATWHERLPVAPDGFPQEASLTLTREEAEYLQDRIVSACSGTLLAWLAHHEEPVADIPYPWLLGAARAAPEPIRKVIDLGRRFSGLMHGAALLYNLMLSELRSDEERRLLYEGQLRAWAEELTTEDLSRWDPDELWRFVSEQKARVTPLTRQFVEGWTALVVEAGPGNLGALDDPRALVKHQEVRLKRGRSRFQNRRALDQWGGASGTARLSYRWPTARRLLVDLYQGLHTRGTRARAR